MIEPKAPTLSAMREIRIIIPAYDEAARLDETVSRLWHHFGTRATLLVVANGCTDETADIVRSLARRYATIELLEITKKIGKGGAVRAGLTLGNEPYVAFVDADGSTAADQVDFLLETCRTRKLSGAIGSRWMAGSRIARKQPLQRRIASRAFNTVTRLVFGLNYTDTQCGAKVFERDAMNEVLEHLEIANFAFDVDVLLSLKRIGKPVEEIPIAWEDVAEYSKVRLVKSGGPMLWALLRLYLKQSVFRKLPLLNALGLSETIPVRFGLDIIFLYPAGANETPALRELIDTLRARGYTARVVRLNSVGSILGFGFWYLRRGHLLCDVIVHDLGPARRATSLLFREAEVLVFRHRCESAVG